MALLICTDSKSTDFEVHRNWLAITHSLPLSQWYHEQTSEWTLDYPPFFAYFELLLSYPAHLADPAMLDLRNLNHASWQTAYLQRGSVVAAELLTLLPALHLYVATAPLARRRTSYAAALSVLLSPGLLIIDHVHFQYNGFLYGILVLSLALARREDTMLASAVLFAALLCLKHIYLYLAPAYFVFLLRAYCLGRRSVFHVRFANLAKLGAAVLGVFALAFGPFVYLGQTEQLLKRLFPFSRGLCHAYWAPNVWAMYSFADRVLIHGKPIRLWQYFLLCGG